MNEENKNTITYDEDWKNVSVSEYPHTIEYDTDKEEIISQKENRENQKKKKDSPHQLLITLQLIVCIIIALVAFALKNIGGDIYSNVREWYYSTLNNSVIFEDDTNFNLDSFFGASTADEA